MDSRGSSSGSNHMSPKVASFLETLRNQSGGSQPLPEKRNPGVPSFEAFQEKRRLEQQRKEQFFQTRVREFNEVYSRSKREETKKIEEVRLKLQNLAKSVEKLNKDVAIVASQKVVDPGVYHLSFFDQLIVMVDLLQKNIDESCTWLELYHSRNKKQSYYWNQANSKGTKFMAANERNVATSIG